MDDNDKKNSVAANMNDELAKTYPDTLSEKAARALAKRLQDYWHSRGYKAARFWAEPIGERFSKVGSYDLYRVVCNLVNGLPPRYRDESDPNDSGPKR